MFSTVFKTYLPTKSTQSFCIFKDGKNSLEFGWFDDCKPIVFPAGTRKRNFLQQRQNTGESKVLKQVVLKQPFLLALTVIPMVLTTENQKHVLTTIFFWQFTIHIAKLQHSRVSQWHKETTPNWKIPDSSPNDRITRVLGPTSLRDPQWSLDQIR